VPPSGYVSSGTTQTASRTYSTEGEKTVKVLAQDDRGLSSPWSTLTFQCSEQETQCTDGIDNDGDGLIDFDGKSWKFQTGVDNCFSCEHGAGNSISVFFHRS